MRCAFALALVGALVAVDVAWADPAHRLVTADRPGSGDDSLAGELPGPSARDDATALDGTGGSSTDEPNGYDLGGYEREALESALEELDLLVVRDPEGKQIGRIHVVNLEPFSDGVGALSWLNKLRRTTRDHVIAREVLLRPGDTWDAEMIAESRRNLQHPKYSSLVVIRPVRPAQAAADDDRVDVLVVTRDVWSLRVTSNFEAQQDALSLLTLSLSETNFMGLRKLAAFRFEMDLGAYSLGPQYVDPNIAGTRIELAGKFAGVFSRETGEPEGSRGEGHIAYPLWSLDRTWGASAAVRHDDTIARSFEGGTIRRYDAPETPGNDALPWMYDRRELEVASEVVRSFRGRIMHRVGLGHELELSRPAVLDSFPGDDVQRAAFERDVLPRSERASSLYLRYQLFQPRFVGYRDLETFDLREEFQLGPDFELKVSAASRLLGSEAAFWRARALAGWSEAIGEDGLVRLQLRADSRLQGGELIDNEILGELFVASPKLGDFGRIVARVDTAARVRETSNRFYTLGGVRALRGYPIGHYTGRRRVRANVELRTVGVPIWLFRAGAVAFWDAGHAADRLSELSLRHNGGIGIRWLMPQFSRTLFRLDWAIPLHGPAPGFPGRITAGGGHVF